MRKLAEVGLLTARKSVGVPETRGGVVRRELLGEQQRFFADFDKNRTIFPCAGWHVGWEQGPRKLVAWVDIDVFSSVKVRGRCWCWRACLAGCGNFLAGQV